MHFSDLQQCCMVSHELGYHHKKIECRIILGPGNREKSYLGNCSTHNREDNSYMGMNLKNRTSRCQHHAVKFKGFLL